MAEGWGRLPTVSPSLAEVVMPLLDEPADLLVSALEQVPHTLVHGDWKAANIGSHSDGRTVLLDFGEASGEASPIADLSWYLALNSDLLPETKDRAISTYRAALEGHGVDTGRWWDRAVALEMLGTMVQFGWEKVLGGPGPELDWWEAWATSGRHVAVARPYDGLAAAWGTGAGVSMGRWPVPGGGVTDRSGREAGPRPR